MKPLKPKPAFAITTIEGRIHLVRGHKIILDHDSAGLYGVSTKALNQAVKRNSQRFPDEFVFRLTDEEADSLRSQIVTTDNPGVAVGSGSNRSPIVTGSQKHRDPRLLPYAFTEHGALMAANVLRSQRAIQMSVLIVQTFVRLQRMVVSVDALARKVEELERATHANRNEIKKIVAAIRQLMTPPETPRREIGFHTRPETTDPAARRHGRNSPKTRKRTDPAATQ
ncbi:MAG: ORF6N domain-containing protein [Verrucomicrobia bacterium]|nr:ORF6N domain-containing protein [Verrucomicrobiota bacterium]